MRGMDLGAGAALKALGDEMRVRHYSPKTLKSYSVWTRKLKNFSRDRDPAELSIDDVKAFLTVLAVDKKVSASSQNQAFNALLFFLWQTKCRAKKTPDPANSRNGVSAFFI